MTEQPKARALVVDDDAPLLRAHARALTKAGYEVETASDGEAAVRALEHASFDVILSDIDMPGINGIRFLEQVRVHDFDVPVVLITGTPSVETAVQAIERGALRYLIKPLELAALVKVADDAVRVHRIAEAKRQALDVIGGVDRFFGDRSALAGSFERAMESLHIAYQPIVSWESRKVYAYEALLRSREPSLPHPGAVLDAAERLGRVHELGRLVRAKAVAPGLPLADGVLLFLNLHPADLLDDELYRADGALAVVASRVVLEITERASLDAMRDVRSRVESLRKLGFRIALDDLGAGYAGLTSFNLLEPDIVKLDMALVRDVHVQPKKQTVVKTMVTMCKELGIIVTSEGVEVPEERDELARAGCDLMQGYLFAKPGDAFPVPRF
jgi:EAL domain-containing protein (putative c-di-GMP-specific phosphodiesterase class I)